jgi:hypothetical protein
MAKPTKAQTMITLVITVLTALSGFLGYEKYERNQAEVPTVTVNVESMPDDHSDLTRLEVEALIKKVVMEERARNVGIYKKLEPWEK